MIYKEAVQPPYFLGLIYLRDIVPPRVLPRARWDRAVVRRLYKVTNDRVTTWTAGTFDAWREQKWNPGKADPRSPGTSSAGAAVRLRIWTPLSACERQRSGRNFLRLRKRRRPDAISTR